MAELAVIDNFNLQTISGDLAQAIAEEMDGLGALPFDRVKIPSGGGIAFELPGEDEDNPETTTEITGIILDHHPVNAYWQNKFAGNSESPDCASYDGKEGIDRVTGDIRECVNCPYNQFGSDGKGKACKNTHRLFILREGNPIPLILSLPPTSIKYMRDYIAKRIVLKKLRCWQVLTRITLKKEKSATGIVYSHAVFTFAGKLNPEQIKKAETMKDCVTKQYRQMDAEDGDYGMADDEGYDMVVDKCQDEPVPPQPVTDGFMNIPDNDVPQFDS